MNRWVARLLALVLAAAAVYLVYINAHGASILLECSLAAASLAIATVVFAWNRPTVASILNAVWLAVAFAAGAVLSGSRELPSKTVTTASATGATAVGAVAKDVGSDPDVLLTRVAHDVRYEIYPGVFRGPFATMADGAGNDYDRALLLHDILVAANPGARLRYAFCTLSSQQADLALAAARSQYRAPAVAANAQTLAVKAATQQLRDDYKELAAFWQAAIAQDREQTTELTADFKKAGAQLAPPNDPNLRSIAADHVWIQVQRQGSWVDLDPSAPNARSGSSLCTPTRTDVALPNSAYDTVTATLYLESRNGAQEDDAAIASGTWRTAELAQTPLMFAFAEPSGLHAPAPQPTGMRAYTPLLIGGTQTIVAAPITVPVPPRGTTAERAASTVAVGGASGAVAAFGSSPPVAATATPSPGGPMPVALRLTVSVGAPNVPVVTAEHTIFDRISASDRAAGRSATAPIAPISTLLPFGTVLNVAANFGTGVVGVGDYTPFDPNSNDSANINRALGIMHRAYYTLRRNVFADAEGQSAPPLVSVRPGVSFLGLAPYAAGPIDFGLTMDRAVEGAVPDGGDATSGLAWGVASLYGERLAIAANSMKAFKDKLDELPFDDSIEMFYIARHTSVSPLLVRSGSDVTAMSASDDVKARLAASIAGGSQAVIPSTHVGYGGSNDDGWWILASDGSVSDEMQNGMHWDMPGYAQSAEEDAEDAPQEAKKGGDSKCVAWAAAALFGTAMAVGGAMGNTESATEIGEKLGEYTHAMYEAKEVEEDIEVAEQCSESGGPKGPPPGRGKCAPFVGPYCKP